MPAFCLNVIREYYLVALRVGGWGGGGDVKELLGFFINHAFVRVFQGDSGTPKHALELETGSEIFGFCPKELNFYGLKLKVQEVNANQGVVFISY